MLKNFFFVTDKEAKLARMFVPYNPFKPDLILSGEARSLPSEGDCVALLLSMSNFICAFSLDELTLDPNIY
jgi:hypothetical protein